jgi:hypothetical protein
MGGPPSKAPRPDGTEAATILTLTQAWQLTELVPKWRREMLLMPRTFESTALELAEIGIVSNRQVRSLSGEGQCWRAEFRVSVPPHCDAVDLFHNGVDGYRSRYLRGEDEGDRANEFIMVLLRPKLIASWEEWVRRPFGVEWLGRSIGAGAKVWVHQGRWSRRNKRHRIRIELAIESWLRHQSSTDCRVLKKVKLGSLCPREFELDVKGLFLSSDGGSVKPPKSPQERARQIHKFGFT